MHTISQLLDEKGRDVWSVAPQTQVFDAIRLMADKGIGALLVMDEERLVGVISERDYARKVILEGRSSRSTPVSEIMTTTVVAVDLHKSVDDCLSIMSRKRIRHLPVVENGRVEGVLSIGDLVKVKLADQEHQIESLEQYIAGG